MTPETYSPRQQQAVLRLVSERTGLAFNEDRLPAAAAAIRQVARRRGLNDGNRLLAMFAADTSAFDELIDEVTVGETYFFRESAHYDFVRQRVLPEWQRRHGPERPLRIWSAGCASGEEPYSLAMLCDEEGLADAATIAGTDISPEALEKARRGVYREWSLRGVPPRIVRRYLRRQGEEYLLDERIRRRVEFGYLNLAAGEESGPSEGEGQPHSARLTQPWHPEGTLTQCYDLIFCRNVLIYFDAATVARVVRRLFDALAPGGWLVTASSDPPVAEHAPFEAVVTAQAIAWRRPTMSREQPTMPGIPPGATAVSAVRSAGDDRPEVEVARAEERPLPARQEPRPPEDSVAALAAQVRHLANRDAAGAERLCADFATRYPLAPELHYLQAVLLLQLDRGEEAAAAARRAIYLDRSLAVAHFTLGTILERRNDTTGACRAYRNAGELAAARPPDEVLPLSEGEPAGRLATAAERRLQALNARPRAPR